MSALIPGVPHRVGLCITNLVNETEGICCNHLESSPPSSGWMAMDWLDEVIVPLLAKLAQSWSPLKMFSLNHVKAMSTKQQLVKNTVSDIFTFAVFYSKTE